ncbi:MAG: ABC transporter permease [Desulfurococcaceae archaeon]|nr:ABC transporter permease [Desulfurococcaceae archaeon]
MLLQLLLDILRMSFKVLTEKKTRAILTIIGISLGPFALVMISSVIDGYGEYVISQVEGLGQNVIVLFPSTGYKFSESDLNTIRSLDGVKRAEPFYSIQGQVKVGSETRVVFIYAIPIEVVFESMRGLEILKGSIPSESEYLKALIGYKIAHSDDNSVVYDVGDVVTVTFLKTTNSRSEVRRVSVVVNAVLKEFGGAFILSPDTTILLPLQAGSRLLGLNEWSGIYVLVKSSDLVPQVLRELQEIYRGKADIISFQSIANIINSVIGAMNFISFAASLSAFAVAISGVAATMITSVVERIREIGVLKALGFKDSQVISMILTESIIMSIIGGVIGISLGIIGAHILASRGFELKMSAQSIIINAPPKITTLSILRAAGLTLLVGVIGGVFPAYRAAKIPPAVALRYE